MLGGWWKGGRGERENVFSNLLPDLWQGEDVASENMLTFLRLCVGLETKGQSLHRFLRGVRKKDSENNGGILLPFMSGPSIIAPANNVRTRAGMPAMREDVQKRHAPCALLFVGVRKAIDAFQFEYA